MKFSIQKSRVNGHFVECPRTQRNIKTQGVRFGGSLLASQAFHLTMMAAAMDDITKQQLLEAFPFVEEELNRLLDLQAAYQQEENGGVFTLTSWLSAADETNDLELLQRVESNILPPNSIHTLIQKALETVFVLGCTPNDDESLRNTKTFLEAMATLVGRRGQRSLIHLFNQAANNNKDDALLWVYRFSIASHILYTGDFPDSLETTSSDKDTWLTTPTSWKFLKHESFVHWATTIAPGVSTAVSTFMHVAIFSRNHPFRSDIPPLLLPNTDHPSALWNECWNDVPVSLALLSPTLGGDWRRLYSNNADGFSFFTMQQAILSYQGPTVILIRSTCGDVFGFCTDCAWKLSRKWFGQESDSFLFTLYPTLAFYPATGEGSLNQYLQLPSIRHSQDLRGLAIGGVAPDRPRLLLTETLEHCRACEFDIAYTPGPLLSNDMDAYFDVDVLEVWATHKSEEAFQQGLKGGAMQASIREATRHKVAKVDKTQFVDDLASGAYLNKAFTHREHVGDRHSFTVQDFREEFDRQDE